MRSFTFCLCLTALAWSHGAWSYEPPRLANGKPDFSGVWQVLNRANDDLEAHPAQAARALRDGPVVPVPARAVVALGATDHPFLASYPVAALWQKTRSIFR